MKKELEELTRKANEKAAILFQRKSNLLELPKVIKEIETTIRKAYTQFFDEKILSKQELITISKAPKRLNLAIQRFYNASKSNTNDNLVKDISIETLDDDYLPRKLGLLNDTSVTINIDLTKMIGDKLQTYYSLIENSNLKQVPLEFELKVMNSYLR